MIEELVLGTETEKCGEFGSGVPEAYRSTGMQGEWCSVYILHTKIYSICVYCSCEPHLVKDTRTASLAD